MNIFDYPVNHQEFKLDLVKSGRKWQHYAVSFPTALPTSCPELGSAFGEYFEPSVKDAPMVILLHGMGDRSILPCKLLAASLAQHGLAAFVPYLPIHTRRLSAAMKSHYPRLTDDEWAEIYRISTVNVRQIIDWAVKQNGNGERPIGILGLSYGGFISAITMGIDSRINAGVLIVMGGNSLKISQASLKWGSKRGYGLPDEEYRQALTAYEKYLDEVARKGPLHVIPPRRSFLTDPLTYTGLLKNRPLYMINARWDEAIPRAATIDFWQAVGKPDITWLPAFHASIWLYYPLIRRRVNRFFRQSLNNTEAIKEK